MVMENDNLTSMRIIIDPATAFTLLLFSRTASTVAHTVAKLYFLSKKIIFHTLFEIFIFCPKLQLWFHEKNCQKIFGWKTRENVGVLSKLNFWTKFWIFEQFVLARKFKLPLWTKIKVGHSVENREDTHDQYTELFLTMTSFSPLPHINYWCKASWSSKQKQPW